MHAVAIMNPLQQGLKLSTITTSKSTLKVAIMNPLQQGLKQTPVSADVVPLICCNNESTTTRIETDIWQKLADSTDMLQ